MQVQAIRLQEVWVQTAAFEEGAELAALRQACPQAGAVVSFLGLVREVAHGSTLERMQIEHYPGMTEKALQRIVNQAKSRWSLLGVRLIHRYGELAAQEGIVLVATASLHRQAAFEACAFIMDYLKTDAPFWKKEIGAFGERWVDARAADEAAKQQWSQPE